MNIYELLTKKRTKMDHDSKRICGELLSNMFTCDNENLPKTLVLTFTKYDLDERDTEKIKDSLKKAFHGTGIRVISVNEKTIGHKEFLFFDVKLDLRKMIHVEY